MLRLFESNEVNAPQALPGGPGVPQPLPQTGTSWDQDQVISAIRLILIFETTSFLTLYIPTIILMMSHFVFFSSIQFSIFMLLSQTVWILFRARVRYGIFTSSCSQKQSEFHLTTFYLI